MAEPTHMENTETGVILAYRAGPCKRMLNVRPVYKDEAVQLGLIKGEELAKKEAAPTPEEAPEAVSNAPDMEGWDYQTLFDFAQKHDIPVHPAAKIPGITKAINRHFDNLEVED